MKYSVLVIAFLMTSIYSPIRAQESRMAIKAEIQAYQDSLDRVFSNRELSPLTADDFEDFSGLDFFPFNLNYRVQAKFVRTPNQPSFKMPTTTSEVKVYEKYGELYFSVYGKEVTLDVFQSHELRETEKYKNYLFLPFRDQTNGEETYGGGRYLEMWIPDSDSVVIDFNKAYNPYCVYNTKYSCPLVPRQNWMDIPIYAGVKDYERE